MVRIIIRAYVICTKSYSDILQRAEVWGARDSLVLYICIVGTILI
jgi:hypothetical protein